VHPRLTPLSSQARLLPVALVLATGLLLVMPTPAPAEDYHSALAKLLADHQRVAGSRADSRAAESQAGQARSAWYPTVTATAEVGRSRTRTTTDSGQTDLNERTLGVSLKQPLWDFGQIGGAIDKAEAGVGRAQATLAQTEQDLLLEGITAYVNLHRTTQDQDFARQSVDNIRRQTGLEESRVALGGGVGSDVLQAKSQLAGAEARLVRAEGALVNAGNRFRALFGRQPNPDDRKQVVPVPSEWLPHELDPAIKTALERNRQLQGLKLAVDGAKAELTRVRGSKFYPDISGVAELRRLRNPSGVVDDRTEAVVKLQLTYPFNTGLEAFHATDAAREGITSAEARYLETLDLVEEQVRNAWQNLLTARLNAERLANQALIVAEFLRLAREERVQGKRSLIDVLSGETSLINARSDAASAEADITLAAFALLRATGLLDQEVLR